MTRSIYIAGVDDALSVLLPDGFSTTSAAEQGAVSIGKIEIDDPNGSFDLKNLNPAYIVETAASPQRIWTGFLYNLVIDRGDYTSGAGRVWRADCVDVNWMLTERVVLSSNGTRTAETDLVRLAWLLANPVLTGLVVSGTRTNLSTNATNLDAADYRYQKPMEILADMAPQSGKVAFAFYNESTTAVELFYDLQTASTYDSTAKISNVAADIGAGVYPPYQDASMELSGETIASKAVLKWVGGVTVGENLTTKSTYGEMTYFWESSRIGRAATAAGQVATVLANYALPDGTVTVRIELNPANVNDILEGQRIQVKFSHLPGLSSYTWMRVIRRAVAVLASGKYLVQLTLSNKVRLALGGGPPSTIFPLPPASAPTYNQAASATTVGVVSSLTATLGAAPVAGDVCVGLASASDSLITYTWPAGWTVIDFDATGSRSLAYSTTQTTTGITVTPSSSIDRFVVGVAVVRGGGYETFTYRAEPGSPGSTTPALPSITPTAGNAAVIVALVAVQQGYSKTADPSGYTNQVDAISNNGSASRRINVWTKTVSPTSGAYTGSPTYASAVAADLYQVVISGTAAADITPTPGQWVGINPLEYVTMSGTGGTTAFHFADRSLKVFYDNQDQTAAIVSYDGGAGTFVMAAAPITGMQVTVQYQGR